MRLQDMEALDFDVFLYYVYTNMLLEMNGDSASMLPNLERLMVVCEDNIVAFFYCVLPSGSSTA